MRSRQRRAVAAVAKVVLVAVGIILLISLAIYGEVTDPSSPPLYPIETRSGGGR
jgi:hypothetical protein